MTFYELLEKYKCLKEQMKSIEYQISGRKTIGNKILTISAEGVSIRENVQPSSMAQQVNLSFEEVKEMFDFLKEKEIL